ncbi:MAG: isocitrate lyase/phosphoenolpyruvate mutase family protein, partial [Chloroflexi bacterium]|nr:isocitrate lyase/phosphoenolpyruvate mutase family protein [Chloroflexota bacterium]
GAYEALLELDWDSNLVWEYRDPMLHHDFERLPNGNTLLLLWEQLPEDLVGQVQGGYQSEDEGQKMYGDLVREITPNGLVVYQWKSWEHLNVAEDIICPLEARREWTHGNALNVMRTVEELETAGVAALTIEDTVLPRTFGGGADAVLPIEEGVGKMKAALAARRDPNMVVAGRTSALRITDLADTIKRVKAYEQAGVDAIFLAGATTKAEVEAVSDALSIPLLLGGTSGELADKEYLGSVGVRVALQGHLPFAASVKAVYDTLKALRDGVPPADLRPQLATTEQMDQFTRKADYAKWTTSFLS